MAILAVLLLIAVMTSNINSTPDIAYKLSDAYELIWNDLESNGDNDGSIWRIKNYQNDYCSIGDVAVNGYVVPASKALLVSSKKRGSTVRPTSFTKVWTDEGSGAVLSVAIYRMNAPSGYTCLGNVAVDSHRARPDASKYCCVKNEYVVRADTMQVYNDKGSDSDSDVSVWQVIRGEGEAFGIDAGNFLTSNGYSQPGMARLLKQSNKVQDIWSLPAGKILPLDLYEMNQLKSIWTDSGSGADTDCTIWRAEAKPGYFPVGDIVVATYSKPKIGFLLRASDKNSDSIRPPVSYYRIWSDKGSGSDKDVQLWKPVCPGGFVSLGNIATNGAKPKLGDIYCVKAKYTVYGSNSNWRKTWTDAGSGADSDLSIYEAVSRQSNQQSVRGFGAVSNYNSFPRGPYFLNKEFVRYHAEKPIEKIYMFSVKYDLNAEKEQTDPVKMSPTDIENHSNVSQLTTRTLTYSVTNTKSFTFSQSISIGIAVEITAGSPIIGVSQKTTISASTTSTFTTGSTTSKTHSDSITANTMLPPHSKSQAVIEGTQYKTDIPFTASIKKIYYDGTYRYAQISGVYKGVNVSKFKVIYGASEPLTTVKV